MHLELMAIDQDTGERWPLTDLYWFEEQGIQDWRGQGWSGRYRFQILVDGVLVWDSQQPAATWAGQREGARD